MTNESESAPETTAPGSTDHVSRGGGGDEFVRDHGDSPSGDTGWGGDRVVKDQEASEKPGSEAGWSGSEFVKDNAERPQDPAGGWSGSEFVKDAGETTPADAPE